MSALRLFWWAPTKDPGLAWPEIKSNPAVWLRLGIRTGRLGRNFGDELSRLVVEAASGRRVVWSPPESADLIAVGSILGLYASRGSGAAVWGSGLREPILPEEAKNLRGRLGPVLAVRGVHTREVLDLDPDLPLGDPGILAPALVKTPRQPRRGILCIPHFRAWSSSHGRGILRQLRAAGIEIAEPSLEPIEMIERIRRSELVLSSSLHGLILSHALGTPCELVDWNSNGQTEPDFKYIDYFSSVGVEMVRSGIFDAMDSEKLRVIRERTSSLAMSIAATAEVRANALITALRSV